MDIDTGAPPSQSYTILRIKRKRNEGPLDALVVESRVRRKKSRGGIDVFQFAQTVEDDVWRDQQRQKDIQDAVSRMARETPTKVEGKQTAVSGKPPTAIPRQKEEIARRYTVVAHEEDEVPSANFATAPPKVISEKELLSKPSEPDFKMYDAIPQAPISEPEGPSEMDKFLPMLTDYLKIHDITPGPSLNASSDKQSKLPSRTPDVVPMSTLATPPASEDYVWDVFYHRPATLSEWNEAANVGTLTGLPPSFGDYYDSASDSEEEDEADEDSNAEEYYKNDYPDEENSSDEFHESSDYDDMMEYKDDAEDLF